MKISGTILNAATGESLANARVILRIGGREVSTHSGPGGDFEWRDDRGHVGEIVELSVEEEGFEAWRTSREIATSEAEFTIRLQPVPVREEIRKTQNEVEPETQAIETKETEIHLFRLRDADGYPIAGAEVRLEGPTGPLGAAVSDVGGEARITMSSEAAERTSIYTVRRQGFVEATGRVEPGQGSVEIVMQRAGKTSIPGRWLVAAAAVVLIGLAGVLALSNFADGGPAGRPTETSGPSPDPDPQPVPRPAPVEPAPEPEPVPEPAPEPAPEPPPRLEPRGPGEGTGFPQNLGNVGAGASVFLSRDSGPGGSTVNVSGEGFRPGERIVIRFHTEQIGTTAANERGAFANVAVTVPTSFSPFAPRQFTITATGQDSVRSASAPFTISG